MRAQATRAKKKSAQILSRNGTILRTSTSITKAEKITHPGRASGARGRAEIQQVDQRTSVSKQSIPKRFSTSFLPNLEVSSKTGGPKSWRQMKPVLQYWLNKLCTATWSRTEY